MHGLQADKYTVSRCLMKTLNLAQRHGGNNNYSGDRGGPSNSEATDLVRRGVKLVSLFIQKQKQDADEVGFFVRPETTESPGCG